MPLGKLVSPPTASDAQQPDGQDDTEGSGHRRGENPADKWHEHDHEQAGQNKEPQQQLLRALRQSGLSDQYRPMAKQGNSSEPLGLLAAPQETENLLRIGTRGQSLEPPFDHLVDIATDDAERMGATKYDQ